MTTEQTKMRKVKRNHPPNPPTWNVQSFSLVPCTYFLFALLPSSARNMDFCVYLFWLADTDVSSVRKVLLYKCCYPWCNGVWVWARVRACEEFINVGAWTAATRISWKHVKKKWEKKISRERFLPLWGHFSVKLPPTFPRAPHHGGPRCHGDLIAQFSPSSLDPFWWNPAQFSPACVQMHCRLYCRDVFLEQSCR